MLFDISSGFKSWCQRLDKYWWDGWYQRVQFFEGDQFASTSANVPTLEPTCEVGFILKLIKHAS